MTTEIYKKLARHLDNLPGGFPSTDTGVELRILRRLFTEEEAEFALLLTVIPKEAKAIARRAGISVEEASRKLEEMSRKGLIYRIDYEDKPSKYMAAQYVIGIWEFHVNDLDPELIRDMNEYIPHLIDLETWKKAPQLRTIPIGESIPVEMKAMSYEKAEELIRSNKKILVAPCICRREHKMVDKGCSKPEESCLVFGRGADYYKKNELGRYISQDEALKILEQADKAGLVLQPSNSQRVANICCCCGCCCQVLKVMKRHPAPAELVSSAFIASYDPETCESCGVCVERCQMDALRWEDDKIFFDPNRCIGCGLCVTTCPTQSLVLIRKSDPEQKDVPRNLIETYVRLHKARKKGGVTGLVKDLVISRKARSSFKN
jgi:NAD-dependent dihydropyrimidine dehydrogenase PreA subunit/DNA-binding Lrp family transcriptional regulator